MGIHPTMEVATLGMWDTMIVMIMALVVFGPRRLPKIGKQIGKLMYEFRKASNDFRFQLEEEMRNAEDAERRQREEAERQRTLAATSVSAPEPAPAEIAAPAQPAGEVLAEQGVEAPAQGADAAGEAGIQAVSGSVDADSPSSYDEAAYEHYQLNSPARETEPEAPGPRIQPPATGAPVPAERPTSRAAAAPAAEPAGIPGGDTEQPASEEAQDLLPSGDENAVSQAQEMRAEIASRQMQPASEAGAETEPAAHHG